MRIVLATGNRGKVSDFRDMISGTGITMLSCLDLDLPSPAETGSTTSENALIKARAAFAATGVPTLADDSGFCLDLLDGWPGVITADLAEVSGGRDWSVAMTEIRDRMFQRYVSFPTPARFVSSLALILPGWVEEVFEGEVVGDAVWPPRGDRGHDLDPIFIPHGEVRSFGEMSVKEKNAHNSRSRAFRMMMPALMRHFGI